MELIETSNADLFPNTPSVSSASLCEILAYWSLTRNYRIASYGEMIANDAFDGNKNFAIDNGLKDAGYAAVHMLTTRSSRVSFIHPIL